jgi:hypothetical protein
MSVASGGLGGIINVETKPSWANETNLIIDLGAGSFSRYSGLINVHTGGDKFQSATKFFLHSARNDFKYINSVSSADPFIEKRKNAELTRDGFMQEFYLRGARGVTSARVWYQHSTVTCRFNACIDKPARRPVDESFRSMIKTTGAAPL